jgi:hypothetical protein
MAEVYTLGVSAFAAAASKTAVSILAGTTRRGRLLKIVFGQVTAPASSDVSSEWQLRRFTADGTGTATTPQQADPLGPAAILSGKVSYSAEPTYAAGAVHYIGINQRATYTWFPIQETEKILTDLTSGHGVGLQCISAPASSTWDVVFFFEE